MTIKVLDETVASQIAAGEVVERPASVVKELLENALDAHARQVQIRIERAGKQLIEVSDDGEGIPATELELAVARHATSKLKKADDLQHIMTLGFRGEALASIGSVSRLSILSKVGDAQAGMAIRVEGGKVSKPQQRASADGTSVRVEDLFFNVPARLKFLKQDATERTQIYNLVTRYSFAYPNVSFKYFEDQQLTFQTSGNGDWKEILSRIYGIEIVRQLIQITFTDAEVSICGFISPPTLTRSNRREIIFFVNGRWIQDIALNSAFVQAYHTLLMVGRFPMGILSIELPPEDIDVNVHPAKAEVRFRQGDRVFGCIQRAARRALLTSSPLPQVSPSMWRSYSSPSSRDIDGTWLAGHSPENQAVLSPDQVAATQRTQNETYPIQPEITPESLPLLRTIGQIGQVYIVAEGPDGLYLIDQHAAHERILFEKFTSKHIPRNTQSLLEPLVLRLPKTQAALLNGHLKTLWEMGFELEEFGADTFKLSGIPALFVNSDPMGVIQSVVEDIEEDESPLQTEIENKIIARVCKRAAIKAGQTLSVEEQRNLIADLEKCNSPRSCPHGRPTMIHLSVDMLERQFGRKGAR